MLDKEITYAFDANRNLVHVDDVPNGNKCDCTCPNCGERLCARNGGNFRKHHFAHISGADCPGAYETMLHLLAKDIFFDRFYSQEPFKISFLQDIECSNTDCKLRRPLCKLESERTNVNLRAFYDTCEKEKSIDWKGNHYIADLLLSNSKDSKIPPLLIEIFVNHKCSDDKIKSGLKILEFKIDDIDSLNNLLKRETFDVDSHFINCYSFKGSSKKKLSNNIKRLVHFPGSACKIETVSCENALNILYEESDLEMNIIDKHYNPCYDEDYYDIELYIAKQFGLNACAYCEHYQDWDARTKYCANNGDLNPQKDNIDTCFERAHKLYDTTNIERKYNFQILKRPITANKPPYHVLISATKAFINDDFLIRKCEEILNEKLVSHEIIVVTAVSSCTAGANGYISAMNFAEKHGFIIKNHVADWEKDGNRAAYYMYDDAFKKADELIYFWDGKEPYYIVNEAEKRHIPFTIVDFSNERALCPKCGCTMNMKNSKRGFFWGCIRFPDCDGIRETNKREIHNILQQYKNSPGNYNISTLNPE